MHEESFRLQEMVVYRIVGGGMTMKTTMVDEESGVIRSPVPAGASRRPDSGGDDIIVRMREHKDGTQKNFTTVARALKGIEEDRCDRTQTSVDHRKDPE